MNLASIVAKESTGDQEIRDHVPVVGHEAEIHPGRAGAAEPQTYVAGHLMRIPSPNGVVDIEQHRPISAAEQVGLYPASQGLSLYEAVNLASIVAKESTGDQEIRASARTRR